METRGRAGDSPVRIRRLVVCRTVWSWLACRAGLYLLTGGPPGRALALGAVVAIGSGVNCIAYDVVSRGRDISTVFVIQAVGPLGSARPPEQPLIGKLVRLAVLQLAMIPF
jgi:hypothetical protein